MSGAAEGPYVGGRTFEQIIAVRRRVIGALILRELQTRFGRSNLGFLWMFFEPLLLGGIVSTLHFLQGGGHNSLPVFTLSVVGYVPYFMFRAMVNKAGGAIQSNLSLLYHRDVMLLDICISRNIIEAVSVSGVLLIFLGCAYWLVGEVPQSPLKIVFAMALMALLSHGLSMMVTGFSGLSEFTERIVHPITYLMMPISGAFFQVSWLPPEWREDALWVPFVSIHELLREGQFGDKVTAYYDIPYVLYWILASNLIGLAVLRYARPRLEMY
ncbi:capsular polysaccharide transport system permease protein [Humitalea rosea]|uniref:Capsular polysaccharide transport system permease protein n=1 Tax=Humitalea rosea TaxID=990373 RepID=A0A2W7I6K9_9PROT|nr:ABC transporter permease [Humitalea rosea]PZW41889.1 capsular polysaccharide transport system permease protein [Humitalea rosea]